MNQPAVALQTLTEKLVARKEGGIGWIIFNNPARHNAVSLDMWQSLTTVLQAYADDPEGQTAFMEKRKPVFQGR